MALSHQSQYRSQIADDMRFGNAGLIEAGIDRHGAIGLAHDANAAKYKNQQMSKLASFLRTSSEYSDLKEDNEDWVRKQPIYEEFTRILKECLDNGRESCHADDFPFITEYDQKVKSPLPAINPSETSFIAWSQVLAAFLVNLNNFGIVNSFGTYQMFYEQTFLSDYNPSAIFWIGTLQASLVLIVGALSGPLFDKGYLRIVVLSAGTTLVSSQMMLSLATKYYQLMLLQGLLTGCCCGLLYISSLALIPIYFKQRRGLALGIASGGGSVGGILYPIIFRRLVDEIGFGWTTRIIGFIMLVTLSFAAMLIRPTGQMKKPRNFFDLRAFRELPFVAFMVHALLIFAAYLVAYFLTPSFASDELHTTEDLSFYLLAVLNATQFFGRVIPAALSDSIGGSEIMLFCAELAAAVLALYWITIRGLGGFVVFLILYGFATGMIATLPASIIPHVSPSLDVIGTRMGMVYGSAGIGALIGAPIAMSANVLSGGYLGAQLLMSICALLAAMAVSVTGLASVKRRRAVARGDVIQGKDKRK